MKILNFSNKKNITFQNFFENQCPTIFGNSWYLNFSKFMVPKTFAKLILFNRLAQAEEGTPFLGPFFGIQCPTIFCDFGLFNRLAQAGGGGALLYDISLPKTYRPKLLGQEPKMRPKSGRSSNGQRTCSKRRKTSPEHAVALQEVDGTQSSLGRYVFGSEISYNKAPPRLPGLGC